MMRRVFRRRCTLPVTCLECGPVRISLRRRQYHIEAKLVPSPGIANAQAVVLSGFATGGVFGTRLIPSIFW